MQLNEAKLSTFHTKLNIYFSIDIVLITEWETTDLQNLCFLKSALRLKWSRYIITLAQNLATPLHGAKFSSHIIQFSCNYQLQSIDALNTTGTNVCTVNSTVDASFDG